jgi:hypothetical protein
MAANRMTPSMVATLQQLRHHGFPLEVHERTSGGYAIMLPIDGNYFDLETALDQLHWYRRLLKELDDRLGIETKKALYKDVIYLKAIS